MKRVSPLALALAVLPASAFAQGIEIAPGIVVTGDVALQYYHVGGGDEGTLLDGDVTLGWRSASNGALSFGAEATFDGLYDSEADDLLANYWASVVIGIAPGDIRIGAPRPVIETMSVMPEFGTNRLVNLTLTGISGSATSLLSREDGGMTPGISFQTAKGAPLSWGVSYHRVEAASTDVDALEGVLNYSTGTTTLFAKAQHLDPKGGASDSALSIGALYEGGPLTLAIETGRSDLISDTDFGRLHAGYQISDALKVSGDMLYTDSGSSNTLWSLGMEYGFGPGAYVSAGALTGDDAEVYDLAVGWRF